MLRCTIIRLTLPPVILHFTLCSELMHAYLILVGENPKEDVADNLDDWVRAHRDRLSTATEIAQAVSVQPARSRKGIYDRTASGALIRTGDRVLLCNHRHCGQNKIQEKWDFMVKRNSADGPVYTVRPELQNSPN